MDQWLTSQLASCTAAVENSNQTKEQLADTTAKGRAVEKAIKQIRVLDLGFSEVVRQVATHCTDRAELINRMWRSSFDLFTVVYDEMSSLLREANYAATREVMPLHYF